MANQTEIERELTRDALSCLICGRPGPALDFDHIKERSTHPHLRDGHPENIAPLCRPCHRLKSIKRIKTWTVERSDGLRYFWTVPENDVEMRSRAVFVDERYGCLRPIEEESHAAQ